MKQFSLPFGIDFVVDHDLPPEEYPRRKGANSYYLECPFCKGEEKLNVNSVRGVWRCNKCDESGNAVTLHAKLKGVDNQTAYSSLKRLHAGLPDDLKSKYVKQTVKEDEIIPAPIEILNDVYTELLRELPLSKRHRANLRKRGLTDEEITCLGYKSLPVCGLKNYAIKPIEKGCEYMKENWGIPGFYDINCEPKIVKMHNGILIPVKDPNRRISGFQIRFDDPIEKPKNGKEYPKYIWFTSGDKKTGCRASGVNNIHFAGDWSTVPKKINLTEGVLKADIASIVSGKPFIGVTGVNNLSQLPKWLNYLKKKGAKHVNIAYDRDYKTKPTVQKGVDKTKEIIEEANMTWSIIPWNDQYKGVDDYLIARRNFKKG